MMEGTWKSCSASQGHGDHQELEGVLEAAWLADCEGILSVVRATRFVALCYSSPSKQLEICFLALPSLLSHAFRSLPTG